MRARGLAGPAALLMAALVLYASLYPFDGWRWPPGRSALELLALPWPPYRLPFDIAANLAGYLPLGLLLALAALRRGRPVWRSLLWATAAPALLSYGAEVAQHFLPGRHPSLLDLALNSAGAALGALLAPPLQALGWPGRGEQALQRWFDADASAALLLLALWPVALLFPTPVVFGLGQIGPRLRPMLADGLDGVPWAEPWAQVLAQSPPALPLGLATEALVGALGLLAPCLVAYAVVAPGWRRVALALGAVALGSGALMLSATLNFGPQHALAWLTPAAPVSLVAATLAALLLAAAPRRLAAGLGLIVLTMLAALVAQAPADPFFSLSLKAWEQGRFIRFHGLAQWVGWLWPYAALGWLLGRLGRPGTRH